MRTTARLVRLVGRRARSTRVHSSAKINTPRVVFQNNIVFYGARRRVDSRRHRRRRERALDLLIGRGDVQLRSEAEISSRGRHFAPRRRRRRRASRDASRGVVIVIDPLVSLSLF
jgi:hypothetical protein